jgi:hypothetical protein
MRYLAISIERFKNVTLSQRPVSPRDQVNRDFIFKPEIRTLVTKQVAM